MFEGEDLIAGSADRDRFSIFILFGQALLR
jgi:hypothetical protein